jgi:membrane-associated phospholipid phosphatase
LRIPALVLAIAVSISRIVVNDHYVGDVLASAAIAALVAGALVRFATPRRTNDGERYKYGSRRYKYGCELH